VVVSDLPPNASEDEIYTFINTYINTLRALTVEEHESKDDQLAPENNQGLSNIELRTGLWNYAVFQINDKQDIEH
jgi:hypothetical protein